MANVIDQLIVKIGLDTKEFKQGEKDVNNSFDKTKKRARETGRDVSASGRQGAEFFAGMQKAALRFFAVLAAGRGLYLTVANSIKEGAAFSRLSQNLQTSTDSLYRWQQAVKQNGGTAEGFTSTINGLSAGLTELMQGGNETLRGFLGILNIDVSKARRVEDVLLAISSAIDAGKLGSNRLHQVNWLKQMGLDEGTINLLLKGRSAVEAQLASQSGYSEQNAKKALEAEQKLLVMQEKYNEAMRQLAFVILPAIVPLIEKITQAIGGIGWLRDKPAQRPTRRQNTPWQRGGGGVSDTMAAPQEPSGSRSSSGRIGGMTRAERNNNPGNLNFAGQRGASLESGPNARFAAFRTNEEGIAALVNQLRLYRSRGIDTISKMIAKYAPANENNTGAYISDLSKWTGLDPNQKLDLNDTDTVRRLVMGISRKEGRSTPLSEKEIMAGISMANNRNNPSASSSVSIGEVKIYTQATDAKGIARDMREQLIMQSNSGMR